MWRYFVSQQVPSKTMLLFVLHRNIIVRWDGGGYNATFSARLYPIQLFCGIVFIYTIQQYDLYLNIVDRRRRSNIAFSFFFLPASTPVDDTYYLSTLYIYYVYMRILPRYISVQCLIIFYVCTVSSLSLFLSFFLSFCLALNIHCSNAIFSLEKQLDIVTGEAYIVTCM